MMYKKRVHKHFCVAPGRFRSKLAYVFNDPDYGWCYSYGHKFSDHVVRIHFFKRDGAPRYLGRRSYRKQPRRPMKVGWYAEYMEREWGVTKRGFRRMR
jgi:hypothetical protein